MLTIKGAYHPTFIDVSKDQQHLEDIKQEQLQLVQKKKNIKIV